MGRTVLGLFFGALLLLAPFEEATAQKEVFICRMPDGSVFMTDNFRQIPPGCLPERRPAYPRGGLSVVPEKPLPYSPPLWIELVERMWLVRPQVRLPHHRFLDEALSLVREHQRLEADRLRSLPMVAVPDFPGWRREIDERREALRARMAERSVTFEERRQVEKVLDLIP